MSTALPPTIDPVAAARWQAQAPAASPWLHEEVARRMQDRLQWMAKPPQSWLDWEPVRGGLQAHALVAQRYPQAQLETGGTPLHHWSDEVLVALAHPAQAHSLPLDVVGGTDFQRRVWAALQRIPGGQTCTYTQLAQALGQPRAVRAVASACAANPVAVLVPCHRVLRSDGGLGGYRWGLARKQQLLAQEAA